MRGRQRDSGENFVSALSLNASPAINNPSKNQYRTATPLWATVGALLHGFRPSLIEPYTTYLKYGGKGGSPNAAKIQRGTSLRLRKPILNMRRFPLQFRNTPEGPFAGVTRRSLAAITNIAFSHVVSALL